MAARMNHLFRACIIYVTILTLMADDGCPKDCFCAAFETDCSKLHLKTIPDESDFRIDTQILRLNDNELDNVAWLELSDLNEYYLQRNQIRNIEVDAFRDLYDLERLDMSENLISALEPEHFQSMERLQELNLSHNKLTKIGGLVFTGDFMNDLVTLDLSYNEIETIDKNAFSSLNRLDTLKLNNNKLKTIQNRPFAGVPDLLFLYLHSNNLETVEDRSFYPMTGLVTLTLNKNNLRRLQQMALYKLESVENLDISDNLLTEMPRDAMLELRSLNALHIGGNPMTVLKKPDFPTTLGSLERLCVSNMSMLTNIDASSFDNLTNLKFVNITNNMRLSFLPSTLFFKSFHILRNVNLSNNALMGLDPELLPWGKLYTLSVTGNRWRCDCNCRWMKNYTFEKDIKCNSPHNLADRTMDDIPEFQLVCLTTPSRHHAVTLALASTSLTLSIVIIVAILFKVRKRLPCFKSPMKYVSLYNIYDPHKDGGDIVVTFRGDKVETKTNDVDLEKDML